MASFVSFVTRTGSRGSGKPPRQQQFKDRAIIFRHDAGRAHRAPRIARHDLVGLGKMQLCPLAKRRAYFRQRPLGDHLLRIVAGDPGKQQALARQIETPEAGVFVDVAQDVGQLQRAAEMMRQQNAVLLGETEHPHRQPPDRAGDAVAIEIERCHVGRADILRHVHLHAVDDGEKILALEAEPLHRRHVILQPRRRTALVQRVDIVAPLLKRGEPLRPRAIRVRDVVDLPAKAVDLEHRLALRARQDAHRGVERAAGCGACRNLRWPPPQRSCAGRRF